MIVEGIETKEQAELLMNYGSYKAQGYYYYKPMPMTEFEQLLIKQQKACNQYIKCGKMSVGVF